MTSQQMVIGDYASDAQLVASLSLDEKVARAIDLLRTNEPEDGYYLAFSGGKDSCVILKLAQMAGVKFDAHYNNTTIDPPELIRFIKQFHPDVVWTKPKHGNMLHRISTAPNVPPTHTFRWCCEEYKECEGDGRVKLMGVRAEESQRRKHIWREVTPDLKNSIVVCPIVYWTGWTKIIRQDPPGFDTVLLFGEVWDFIRKYEVPYCSLYDEGWDRLGCVGCMLQSKNKQQAQFERWPKYREGWKRAIYANWEKWHEIPNTKTGEPRFQAAFATAEDLWQWWLNRLGKTKDLYREDCQSGILWTNEEI